MTDLKNAHGSRINFALEWLKTTTQSIKTDFYSLNSYKQKEDCSEVTDTDIRIEREFRKKIKTSFPNDGVTGEEFGASSTEAEYTWTIDPIDGTRGYVYGVPFFGTMVGLYISNTPIFGAINYPALGEMVYAVHEYGCYWLSEQIEGQKVCKISNTGALTDSVAGYSGFEYFKKTSTEDQFYRLLRECKFARTWGDCYGYCLLIRGKIDLVVEPALKLWDTVPLQVLVKEAGGLMLDIKGESPSIGFDSAVIGNARLVREFLAASSQAT